jgi:DNA-directed RNA polymerase subunit N
MLIPVRCFSCGKPIGHLWEEYKSRVAAGEEQSVVLRDLGLDRYCCRAAMLGNAELLPRITKFKKS